MEELTQNLYKTTNALVSQKKDGTTSQTSSNPFFKKIDLSKAKLNDIQKLVIAVTNAMNPDNKNEQCQSDDEKNNNFKQPPPPPPPAGMV